jgi:hypothetical protein
LRVALRELAAARLGCREPITRSLEESEGLDSYPFEVFFCRCDFLLAMAAPGMNDSQ